MKIGRNKPCPCGSGLKFKHCCTELEGEERYDGFEPEEFYDNIEEQYEQGKKDGIFEVLRVLELDREHSNKDLVEAVDYFNRKKVGHVEEDAPTGFLNAYEIEIINRGGTFRAKLYSMLLSMKFSNAIQEGTAFITHSREYSFGNEDI